MNTLLVVGDSLAVDAEPHLASALPEWRIQTLARNGMETAEGVTLIASAPSADVIVASLGTNDDPADVASFAASVEKGGHLRSDPRLMVVDWPALARANSDWLKNDGIHATTAGDAGRAEAIAEAVRSISVERK